MATLIKADGTTEIVKVTAGDRIERDGRLLFTMLYLYWLWRYGCRGNPYEIEARAAETLWRAPV